MESGGNRNSLFARRCLGRCQTLAMPKPESQTGIRRTTGNALVRRIEGRTFRFRIRDHFRYQRMAKRRATLLPDGNSPRKQTHLVVKTFQPPPLILKNLPATDLPNCERWGKIRRQIYRQASVASSAMISDLSSDHRTEIPGFSKPADAAASRCGSVAG